VYGKYEFLVGWY